jgi:mannose-6-phosphate isomerase-like protein (cupin superfamily)
MAEYKLVKIDDIEGIVFGTFKRARAALGVQSFGLQVLDLPPNLEQYPEHDHADDGQEEVYVVLRGSGEIEIDGERHPLDSESLVSIQAGTKRKLWPGPEGMRVVAIGGQPGKVFEIKDVTELGAPDTFSPAAAG